MNHKFLISLLQKNAKAYTDSPGEAIFSSIETLEKNNGIIFMGLNPGGNSLPPIKQQISIFWNKYKHIRFSGFIDQCWHKPEYSLGKTCRKCKKNLMINNKYILDRHQKNVSELANKFKIDLRNSLATNSIWIQSKNASELEKEISKQYKSLNEFFSETFFKIH